MAAAKKRKKKQEKRVPRPPPEVIVKDMWARGMLWMPEAARRLGVAVVHLYTNYRRAHVTGERVSGRLFVDVRSVTAKYGEDFCKARKLGDRPW